MGKLLLRGLVEVGAELRKAGELLVRSKVQTEVAGDLLHGLGLCVATDAGHGNAHVDCRALALEEELGLQVDLTIGNGNDVGRNVGRDVAVLGLDDRQCRHGAITVLLGHLDCTREQTRVQVEDVARIGLASGRTMQRQRHLTVGHGLLGQVVVDDEHVAAGVGLAGGLAVLTVVHEELADSGTGHRRDVLHRGGIGSGGRNDDGVVERTVLSEGLADVGNRGGLLADGDIDADHALAALVEDSVDGDGGLTCLTVADDEQTGLNRLTHRGTVDDAGGLELNGATVRGDDVAQAVDGLAERIDDAAEHGAAHRDIHNAASGAALVAFLDGVDGTKQNGADLVTVKVLGKAEDGLTGIGALELQKLACHGALEAGDARDAGAYLVDR